ncbi:MAG TPA: FtsH protease activity modulator HflK [Burkholderiales bacterium]|jgi:membrane protease subunit HflK|nr:FtsH protease activity modulator HflK [Burkholderiales bacterium]
MSLNDPNWGRGGSRGPQGPGGGNQGPPDLDELWRNFNRKLNELFGRGRRGAEPPPPGGGGVRHLGGGASVLVALVVIVWLASGFYIVDAASRGIVLTFGRYSEETGPGLRWRLPWPIQTHELVNLAQVRTLEVGYRNNVRTKVLKESLMLTDDENIVDLQFAVQYTVKDARDYIFNVRRPDESAQHIAETAMREVIGKSKMDAILYETQVDIANKAHELMQQIHDRYGTGIAISAVTIQNAQPPEQVQAAFDDAVKANQDRERQKNEGQAYANDVIPRARGTASRLLQEAEGYKQRVIANAEGEASRFKQVLAEYSKAPGITRERMYIDTMTQILSATNKIMLDYKGAGNLLYLPLDKLMQQAGSSGQSEAQASQRPSPDPVVPDAGPRSRDTLRNRERGER